MNRDEAYAILVKHTSNKNLIKHGLAVEAVMKHFASLNNEDVTYWGNVGLLHDVDYEKYPDEHCKKCAEILKAENVEEDMIKSIQSHGYGICSDVKPEKTMEKILYTIDELTGLIIAVALMRPNKSLAEVDLEAIKKKWNKKGFASGADRGLIEKGAELARFRVRLCYIRNFSRYAKNIK